MKLSSPYTHRKLPRRTNSRWDVYVKLERYRLWARISQMNLAKRVGVSRKSISEIETGKSVPSLGLALKIARVFGLKVEDIFRLKALDNQSYREELDRIRSQ